jgi:hypothetical protein
LLCRSDVGSGFLIAEIGILCRPRHQTLRRPEKGPLKALARAPAWFDFGRAGDEESSARIAIFGRDLRRVVGATCTLRGSSVGIILMRQIR